MAGSLFIIVVAMIVQLAIIFLTVGYNSLARSFPFLHEISFYFRYLVAYPVFFLVLFSGGYITASISEKRVLLHCGLVGLITVGISMISALDYMTMTVTGIAILLLAVLAIMAGGLYWQKNTRV